MTHLLPTDSKPGLVAHPLGNWVYRVASTRPGRARGVAVLVFVTSLALLVIASGISPARAGLGSHQQLGLAPCISVTLFGYPCPTCGMTTAFAHTVRGNLLAAFQAQPAGLVLALGTLVATGLSLVIVVTGKVWVINWYRLPPNRIVIGAVLLVLGGWFLKVVMGMMSGSIPMT